MILGVCRRILGDDHAAEDAFQATFLVLVRRARMVPWRESLGGWLHGTARRVALRARRAAGVSRLIQQQSAGSRRPLADPDPSEAAAARGAAPRAGPGTPGSAGQAAGAAGVVRPGRQDARTGCPRAGLAERLPGQAAQRRPRAVTGATPAPWRGPGGQYGARSHGRPVGRAGRRSAAGGARRRLDGGDGPGERCGEGDVAGENDDGDGAGYDTARGGDRRRRRRVPRLGGAGRRAGPGAKPTSASRGE